MTSRWVRMFISVVSVGAVGLALYSVSHDPAPAVTFVSLQGEKVSTAQLRGRVAIVNFWATDCPICMADMPQLVETYNRYRKDGLELIAVAMRYDPPNYVIAYSEKNRLPFKVALDPMGELARRFGDVRATPTTFVIDKRGDIVKRITGAPDFGTLRALLEQKLAEPEA